MGINKSTTKKLEYHKVFWPGNIKSTGTVNRYFRVVENKISNRLKCDEIENSQCSIYAALLYVLKVHGLLRIEVKKVSIRPSRLF